MLIGVLDRCDGAVKLLDKVIKITLFVFHSFKLNHSQMGSYLISLNVTLLISTFIIFEYAQLEY